MEVCEIKSLKIFYTFGKDLSCFRRLPHLPHILCTYNACWWLAVPTTAHSMVSMFFFFFHFLPIFNVFIWPAIILAASDPHIKRQSGITFLLQPHSALTNYSSVHHRKTIELMGSLKSCVWINVIKLYTVWGR